MDRPTSPCARVRAALPEYLGERMDEDARNGVRAHLQDCDACRDAALALDPSRLFLAIRRETLPADFWAGWDDRLQARIAGERRGSGWAALVSMRRPAWAAPLAAAAVLAVTFMALAPGMIPGFRERLGGVRLPYVQPDTRGRSVPAHPARAGEAPPGAVRLDRGFDPGPPLVEEIGAPGARVYRFEPAEGGDAPIYFVVDDSIVF